MYQLIVKQNIASCIWLPANQRVGDVAWVRSIDAARHLVESGLCEWPKAIASEVQVTDGFQTKEGGPQAIPKEFYDAPRHGRLTDSQSLIGAGLVIPSRV